jgi:hypothetical protein
MSKKWKFTYEEEKFFLDKYGNESEDGFMLVGIITNGKDYLFYKEFPEEDMVNGIIDIYSSILMTDDDLVITVPNTDKNKKKILDALNSLTEENADRFCGENSILHEIF